MFQYSPTQPHLTYTGSVQLRCIVISACVLRLLVLCTHDKYLSEPSSSNS